MIMGNINRSCRWPNCDCAEGDKDTICKYENPELYANIKNFSTLPASVTGIKGCPVPLPSYTSKSVKIEPSCVSCRFYKPKDEGGDCRKNPPVRLPRAFAAWATGGNRVRDEKLIWGWPHVELNDWCGEFKERK